MSNARKSITFIIPHFAREPTGGIKIVYQYAQQLLDWGCDITLCCYCATSLKRYRVAEPLRRVLCRLMAAYYPRWYKLDSRIKKKCIFSIDDKSIPEGTDVVATAAITAEPVAQLGPESGSKHYLIQDFEIWDMPELEVRSTYCLGMSNIVVSNWLKKLVWDESGVEPRLIKNSINASVFYTEPGVERHPHEIACLYHEGKHKGFTDLFQALKLVKREVPDLVVNAFGGPERPSWLPDWFRYTQSATQDQLRVIYSRSAVYACATVNEGFGLTLAESMFCGCALASTRFQGVWEYATEESAMLSPVHDPEALAANIVALLKNPEKTSVLASRGRKYAMEQCSMDKARVALRREFGIE